MDIVHPTAPLPRKRKFHPVHSERWLRKHGYGPDDGRGRHSTIAQAAEHQRRVDSNMYNAAVRFGLDGCDCTQGKKVSTDDNYPIVIITDECGAVCTGCGTVLGGAVLHHEYSGVVPVDAADNRVPDQYSHSGGKTSMDYDRNVHVAEVLALATLRGPRIPDEAMVRIEHSWRQYCRETGRELDAMLLNCTTVRRIIRFMSARERKAYSERWLQIIQRLENGDYYPDEGPMIYDSFARYGPPVMPVEIAQDIKARFHWFNYEFNRLKLQSGQTAVANRHNIPFLPTVIRHLLYQTCMRLVPRFQAEHLAELKHDAIDREDSDRLVETWRVNILRPWQMYQFYKYEWYFRKLKTFQSRVKNEVWTMIVIKQLYNLGQIRLKHQHGHILKWVPYRCLLPAEDKAALQRDPTKWVRQVHSLLFRPSSKSPRRRTLSSSESRSASLHTFGDNFLTLPSFLSAPEQNQDQANRQLTGDESWTSGQRSSSFHSVSSSDGYGSEPRPHCEHWHPRNATLPQDYYSEPIIAIQLNESMTRSLQRI